VVATNLLILKERFGLIVKTKLAKFREVARREWRERRKLSPRHNAAANCDNYLFSKCVVKMGAILCSLGLESFCPDEKTEVGENEEEYEEGNEEENGEYETEEEENEVEGGDEGIPTPPTPTPTPPTPTPPTPPPAPVDGESRQLSGWNYAECDGTYTYLENKGLWYKEIDGPKEYGKCYERGANGVFQNRDKIDACTCIELKNNNLPYNWIGTETPKCGKHRKIGRYVKVTNNIPTCHEVKSGMEIGGSYGAPQKKADLGWGGGGWGQEGDWNVGADYKSSDGYVRTFIRNC